MKWKIPIPVDVQNTLVNMKYNMHNILLTNRICQRFRQLPNTVYIISPDIKSIVPT